MTKKRELQTVTAQAIGRMTVALVIICGAAVLPAQEQTPGLQGTKDNSLGMTFVEIPGTTVLFATNETRVSDYQAFVADAQYAWSFKLHFQQQPDHPVVGVCL